MIFRSPTLKTLSSLSKQLKFNSHSHSYGLLDPSRHITMNHTFHNYYIDYYPIGQYPEVYIVQSIFSKTYQPQVQKIILSTLKSKYKIQNLNQKQQNFYQTKWANLFTKIIKTPQSPQYFLQLLLQKLAHTIIVKQSKWTWTKQQQMRLKLSNQILQANPSTIQQFLDIYNQFIQYLISASNLGLAHQIQGQLTPQQKHYYQQLNDKPSGIKQLQDPTIKQNTSLINTFMNKLHTL